jgi:hypothetical protein
LHWDAWRASRAVAMAARPWLFTEAARHERGRKGKGEKEEGDVAAIVRDPLASGTGAGKGVRPVGGRLVGPRTG